MACLPISAGRLELLPLASHDLLLVCDILLLSNALTPPSSFPSHAKNTEITNNIYSNTLQAMAPLGPFDPLPERGHQQHHQPQVTAAHVAEEEALTSSRPITTTAHKNGRAQGALVIVDPISSGAILALLGQKRDYRLIAVYSEGLEAELKALVPAECNKAGLHFDHVVEHTGNIPATAAKIRALFSSSPSYPSLPPPLVLKSLLVGCESGVALYDALIEELLLSSRDGGREGGSTPSIPAAALKGNVPSLSLARRNKYLMGEAIRSAGLRAVKQIQTSDWTDIPPFLDTCRKPSLHPSLPPSLKVVLKPLSSAGSDGVFFASSEQEVREAFDTILSSKNVFGEKNTSVLVQEYLRGTEFVVDSISHEGVHRVTALWRYDKRPLNGAAFVYYGLRLFESEGGGEGGRGGVREVEWALARYAHRCLDALGIKNGFSHAEVMWVEGEGGMGGEPCLVEVGARPHGGEGTFVSLTEAAIGYNQLSVALDLIEDPHALTLLPILPPRLKAHAAEVCLVSRQAGRLVRHFLEERVNTDVLPSLKVRVGVFMSEW